MSEPRLARGEPLDDQARAWIVRLASERAGDADRADHEAWLAISPAHRAAWDSVYRSWALLGALGGSAAEAEARLGVGRAQRETARRASARRRSVLAASVGAVLLSAGAWAYAPMSPAALLADEATAPGEQRTVVLEDGTRIAMNGATALDWSQSPDRRDVELIDGEAMFEVAHNSARPLTVRAGDARIRVTGTRFNVRVVGGRVVAALAEGSIEASRGDGEAARLAPGESATWKDGVMRVAPVAASDIGAWREGRVVFRSRPLSEVIDELALYRRGRIILTGDAGAIKVTGIFDPRDPDRVLRSLGQTLPIRVDNYGPLTFVRPAA